MMRALKVKMFRISLMSASVAVIAATAVTPAVAQAQVRSFDIPAQPLSSALLEFSRQSDVLIVVAPELTEGKRAPALRAALPANEAIARLLRGSGLRAVPNPRGGYRIEPARASSSNQPAQTTASLGEEDVSTSEEIVVTGSHIRGAQAAGSKLIVVDREMIDRSGHGRIQDVLATLPQNFGVMNENNSNDASNRSRGAGVQLRGLGIGTTLVLVDGQRQAAGGGRGAFTNIASIPASAVERIEILPEGASAIYGADAIGGVLNIILRKDFSGAETRVRVSTAGGEAEEKQFSQLFGISSSTARLLVGYDYYERSQLGAGDRRYSASNDDLRRFGGDDFRSIGGNPGTILDDSFSPTHAIPAGQNGTNLTDAQLVPGTNYSDDVTYGTILPWTRSHSAFLNASIDIGPRWEAFVQARYASRDMEVLSGGRIQTFFETVPVSNAFNRFGRPVNFAFDLTKDLGPQIQSGDTKTYFATGGLRGKLGGDWEVKLAAAYGRENDQYRTENGLCFLDYAPYLESSDPNVALNVFGDGANTNPATMAALRCAGLGQAKSTMASGTITANGSLFELPAGKLRLAIGADYRTEKLSTFSFEEAFALTSRRNVDRNISALFFELGAPILGPSDAISGNRLEVSVAGRYEDYSDFGSTFNPKIGLTWRATSFAALRGTWGTSFRAPPFHLSSTQFGASSASSGSVVDPLSTAPGGRSQVLVLSGNNPDVQEETATVWTAGVDLNFPVSDGLRASLTYFDIDYKDKIGTAGESSALLIQEDRFRDVITRNPSQSQIDAICGLPYFRGSCAGPIAAILDVRTRNLARVRIKGLDADLSLGLSSAFGSWQVGLRGTYTFEHLTRVTDTSPGFDVIDTVGNPLAFRASGYTSWNLGPWSAGLTVNHAGAYKDVGAIPERKVSSWTTVDLNLSYEIKQGHGLLDGTRLQFGVINLFDKEPPFVNQDNVYGYDQANANLLGRQISLQLIKAW